QVADQRLDEVLDRLLAGMELAFEINDDLKLVVIKERPAATSKLPTRVLAFQQSTGRVVDSLGKPLSGASIQVMTAGGGIMAIQTQTNRNGEFTLRNVPQDAFLRISYVGF